MKFNFKSFTKTFVFCLSLFFNLVIIFILVLSSFQKNTRISCSITKDNTITIASIVNFPKDGQAGFEFLELTLKPKQKAFLQYSIVSSDQKQANFLINALYDPSIIKVTNTGLGIEILALSEGSTLMQMITIDGIKNIANITVEF